MIAFFANIFGYILNYIYLFVKNYGIAIILFSILFKLALLPLSIKQQKTMKKSQKMQGEIKKIQDKYKNNSEQMSKELMDLYKRENMSPFSGCFSSIIQIVLLFAMFYLVRQPLTYMKKIDESIINNYASYIKQEKGENSLNNAYQEISIIKYANNFNENEKVEENIKDAQIEMDFLGIDLSNIPSENYKNWRALIIPALYVISSIISVNLSTSMTKKMKQENNKEEDNKKEEDPTENMGKTMVWMMPIMSISISLFAPLGLALYWLVNNVLIIIERLILDRLLSDKEEEKNA